MLCRVAFGMLLASVPGCLFSVSSTRYGDVDSAPFAIECTNRAKWHAVPSQSGYVSSVSNI